MRLDELFRLHEHAARTAAGVVDAAFVGLQHFNHGADDRARGVELAAALAFAACELAKEVFIDPAQHIAGLIAGGAQGDAGDQVDQLAQHDGVQRRAAVVLGQDALQGRVDGFDSVHRLVDQAADAGLLGAGLKMRPARILRHPEDVFGQVFVLVLGPFRVSGQKVPALGLEAVRDVLEEDQTKGNVLVVRRLHVAAQLVSRLEQARLEPKVRSVVRLRHALPPPEFVGIASKMVKRVNEVVRLLVFAMLWSRGASARIWPMLTAS